MRKVPEWIGKHDGSRVPVSVHLRVWERCQGKCPTCSRKIGGVGTRFELDHIMPLALGGRHREGNLQFLCSECHRAKTSGEITQIRKSDRVRAKSLGLKKSPRPIQGWRRFDGTPVRANRRSK